MAKTARAQMELERAELLISNFLRYGVLACAFLLSVGLALALAQNSPDSSQFDFTTRHALKTPPYQLGDILNRMIHLDPDGWLAAGLLLLIGIPVIRVGLTVILFVIEKDRIYLAITLTVLAVLLSSLYFGRSF